MDEQFDVDWGIIKRMIVLSSSDAPEALQLSKMVRNSVMWEQRQPLIKAMACYGTASAHVTLKDYGAAEKELESANRLVRLAGSDCSAANKPGMHAYIKDRTSKLAESLKVIRKEENAASTLC